MARPRKYKTAAALERKIDAYFASISRKKTVTEKIPTGEKDEYGHMTYRDEPVVNQLGEVMTVTEYLIPPTVAGLCDYLHIDRSTWALLCDEERYPEFFDATTRARGRLQAWNEEQLLTRKGADIKGIVFNLQNNYGYAERQQVTMGGSIEQYIRESGMDGGAEF